MLFTSNALPKKIVSVNSSQDQNPAPAPICANAQIPQDGLVSSYLFQGTGVDGTTTYNLTETNMEYHYLNSLGIVGYLNGIDGYLTTPSITGMTNWTMTFWFESIDETKSGFIFMGQDELDFSIKHFGDNEYLSLISAGNEALVTPNNSLPVNTLNHVVITSTSTGVNIYINGVISTSSQTAYDMPTFTYTIGTYSHEWSDMFLANFHLYSRVLTDDEITGIYSLELNRHNVIVDDGLVQFYPLNGNSLDNGVNQIDGVSTGLTYTAEASTGLIMADFDGSSSSLSIDNTVALTSWSMGVWFEPKGSTYGHLLIASDATTFEIKYLDSDNRVYIQNSANGELSTPNSSIQDSVLQHIVITSTDTKTFIYVNGVQVAEADVNYSLNADTFKVGSDDSTYSLMTLSNLRLYDRVITADEVVKIYNMEKPNSELCPLNSIIHDPDPYRDGSGLSLWRFEGNLLDDTGNLNLNGSSTTSNADGYTQDGIFNRSIILDGSAKFIESSSSVPEFNLQRFNMSCWVRFNTLGSLQFIMNNQAISHSSGGANAGTYISITPDNQFSITYMVTDDEDYTDSNGNSATSYSIRALSSTIAQVDTWYHVSGNFDDNSCSLYINGVLDANVSTTQLISWDSTEGYFSIGSYEISSGDYHYYMLDGSIDQARFFSRVLTEEEINAIYTGDKSYAPPVDSSNPSLTIWTIDNSTFASLDNEYIADKAPIEDSFHYDSSLGIGWGTSASNAVIMTVNVPPNVTDMNITFSGDYKGLGRLIILDQDSNELLSFLDGWSDDDSGQRLHISDVSVYENDVVTEINRVESIPLNGATSLTLNMQGSGSSYTYAPRYIKELKFT